MVTSRDVARYAGVSQTTVSRCLNGLQVREPNRIRVEQALRDLGYVPNRAARAMRTGQSRTIGVVTARLTNPFYPQLLDALTEAIGEAGFQMALWNSDGPGSLNAAEAVRQGAVDAMVFTTADKVSPPLLAATTSNAPVVFVNRVVPGLDCDRVVSDNAQGGKKLARYFARHGRRRVALISGSSEASTTNQRRDGFLAGAREVGLEVPQGFVVSGEMGHESGVKAMSWLLDQRERPDAVFCVNDLIALGAFDAARSRGLSIPHECWLAGFDDIEMATWSAYDLTTVRQDLRAMARRAVDVALRRIEHPADAAEEIVLDCEVIVRGSTNYADI